MGGFIWSVPGLRDAPAHHREGFMIYFLLRLQIEALIYLYLRLTWFFPSVPLSRGEFVSILGLRLVFAFWSRGRKSLSNLRFKDILHFSALPALVVTVLILRRQNLLTPPGLDPDNHAYMLKNFLHFGGFFEHFLNSDVRMTYTSGYVVLNSVWAWLTGLPITKVVISQPLIQYCLFLLWGWAWVFGGLRSHPAKTESGWRSLGWGVLALVVAYSLISTWNPAFAEGRAALEGSGRLAHQVLLIAPFWMASSLLARAALQQSVGFGGLTLNSGLLAEFSVLSGFCLIFAVVLNPSHFPVQLSVSIGAVVFLLWNAEKSVGLRKRPVLILAGVCVFLLLLGIGILKVDPFFSGRGEEGLNVTDPVARQAPLLFWDRLLAVKSWLRVFTVGLRNQLIDGFAWRSLMERGALPGAVLSLVTFVGFRWRLLSRSTRRFLLGAVLSAVITFVVSALSVAGILEFVNSASLSGSILMGYATGAHLQLLWLMLLWLGFVLGRVLLGELRPRFWALAPFLVCLVFSMGISRFYWARYLRPPNTVGNFSTESLKLRDYAAANVDVAQGERVLMNSWVMDLEKESWVIGTGHARVIALFSELPTAFYNLWDGKEFTARNWKLHLGRSFDPQWLSERGIVWYVDGDFPTVPERERFYEKRFCIFPGVRGAEACVWRLKREFDARLSPHT
jgi:hypothetical protein